MYLKIIKLIMMNMLIFSLFVFIPVLAQAELNKIDTLQKSQQQFAQDVVRLLVYMMNQGYTFTFGETMRTPEQAALYAKQGKGIKNSLHCKRLAIDINLFSPQGEFLSKSEDHTIFGEYWESLDSVNRWGGRFTRPDGNHYERNDSFDHVV